MEKLIDISTYPVANVLDLLLQDKATKKNIIWATDTYEEFGEEFADTMQINVSSLLRHTDIIRPRIQKSLEAQAERTRKKAEVFTPAWLCNQMNNACDEDWFGRKDVFNTENDNHTWTIAKEKIAFPKRKSKRWQRYVDSRRLEITCGEAPYLVSRYDVSTGTLIVPPLQRIGMLDRKLRIVNENTDTYEDWLKWTLRAFDASYGYEYQGDNVLIARINLLLTFVDYYEERWQKQPNDKLLKKLANRIAWNIWQMDGLKDTVPLGKPYEQFKQITLFDMFTTDEQNEDTPEAIPCRISNWRSKNSLRFIDLKEMNFMGKKLFDYVIGNPPYQQDSNGANESDTPLYHYFYDETFKIANVVELITPARFLFNAGYTPKIWNKKMLNDEHFKILFYEPKSNKIFSNTDIKGGIAIGYRNVKKNYGAIGVFTAYPELNSIKSKVDTISKKSLCDIITNRGLYRYSKKAYKEQPEEMKKTADARIAPSAFERMPLLFTDEKPNDGHDYIRIYGNIKSKRFYKWFRKDYVKDVDNLYKYKVMIPKANGSGVIGEVLSTPLVGSPLVGFTETYISIGETDSKDEAEAILKYIKSKFARTMLGILKVTQNNAKPTWVKVPMQDFTEKSDIDWSKSIHEIDLQLYKKYGLDKKEIEFIETHIKEMA
ncbi:Eco57I restriction-modification methylase domain-containing protein [Megamonas hypermegale]|uniref:Eco57I restriction-modification methylase domain-containing protein n=1 Tax=Megamonas hypermegale TaxID=158847 RepID=UPI0026EDBEF5|nr:Eco57I restriction-modification methylase domain-containing protein [Megamonas hypermegale]